MSLYFYMTLVTQMCVFYAVLWAYQAPAEPHVFDDCRYVTKDSKLTTSLWSLRTSFCPLWEQGVEQISVFKQEILYYYCPLHPQKKFI